MRIDDDPKWLNTDRWEFNKVVLCVIFTIQFK